MIHDVPSPIDLRLMSEASEWESTAMSKRPWRTEYFAEFGAAIKAAPDPVGRVLELGSGPGFLAEHYSMRCRLSPMSRLIFRRPCISLPKHGLDHFQHAFSLSNAASESPPGHRASGCLRQSLPSKRFTSCGTSAMHWSFTGK